MDLWKMDKYMQYEPVFDENPTEILENIIRRAKLYLPEEQIHKIYEAYEFSKNAHKGVTRFSGEPYIVHPLRTTEILMDIKPDVTSIEAALLHDVIEDTDINYEDIKVKFGWDVANLCAGLEKVSKIKYRGEERQLETLKKTFIAMAKDIRVIFIKLADRIHNVQTLQFHPKVEKRVKIADETMKIFVPIARNLGLYHYQLYLENGAFRTLNEPEFTKIFNHLKKSFGTEGKYKDKGMKIISDFLHKEGIKDFSIEGRLKSPRRIYEKMQNKYQSKDISNVMDVLAYRIVAETVADCYMMLGVIHKYYTPLIKKIKDYIAIPKFNGYKSIHTTVLGIFRFPTEIQIRTKEMDEVAKYGIAAHFEYSDKGGSSVAEETQSKWVKKIQKIVNDYKNTDEKESFKDDLNIEILDKSNFLYTPNGDVIELPHGSTVLDFAFRVHSDIGLRYKGAIVNGEMKPMSYIPKMGEVVEIHTLKNKYTANKHWFEFIHTPSAKSQLNRFLKVQMKQEILSKGLEGLNKKLQEFGLPAYGSDLDLIKKKMPEYELERKFFDILNKKDNYSQLIKAVYPEKRKEFHYNTPRKPIKPISAGELSKVVVDCDKDIDYYLCPECNPKVPDIIIARTGKDGIKIHNLSCKALKTLSLDKLLEAHWDKYPISPYKINIEMEFDVNYGSIINVMTLFSDMNIAITKVSIHTINENVNRIDLDVEIYNPTKLAFFLNDLKKYKDSIKVLRKRFIF